MRERDQILNSLEKVFREAFSHAEAAEDEERMKELDFEYQREQLRLEVLLDLRELLTPEVEEPDATERAASLIDKAQKIRRITRRIP